MDNTELTPGTIVVIIAILITCTIIWKGIIKFWISTNRKVEEEKQLEEIKKNNPNLIPLVTLLNLSDAWMRLTDEKRDLIVSALCEDVEHTNRLYKEAKQGKKVIINGMNFGKVTLK